MSNKNPGIIFDASNSWNGYNHQGKLALLFSIRQILEVFKNNASKDENKKALENYFVEIEYLEDFSFGKIEGDKIEYNYVHQVKDYASNKATCYNDALLGLAYHVKNLPTIQKAYLHVTSEIDFKGKSIQEYVKELISSPNLLNDILNRISEVLNDETLKSALCEKKKGRPEDFKVRLKQALLETDETQTNLDESNIDKALISLKKQIEKQIKEISSLSKAQIEKIQLFEYDINGTKSFFCDVNQIEDLIKKEIKNSIKVFELSNHMLNEKNLKYRYLYICGKLDEHIIDRDLNYPLYKDNTKDRKIRLNTILDWLTCDIDTADESFYQYELKESLIKYSNEYCCDTCKFSNCDDCMLIPAINKISQMTNVELNDFLALTCPSNNEPISMHTFQKYLTHRKIRDPFLKGISEISIPFEENKQAITYINNDTLQYILTTIELDDDYDDNATVCTDIIMNKLLFELLMDYDCFISKNMRCSSVLDEAQKLGISPTDEEDLDEKRKEHISRLKHASVITLEDFITKIRRRIS